MHRDFIKKTQIKMKIGNLIALNALATANPVAQQNPMMNMLLMEKMMGDDSDSSSILPMLMMSPGLFGKLFSIDLTTGYCTRLCVNDINFDFRW